MAIVKSKLGCKLPKRSRKEIKSGVTYIVGNTAFEIPKERVTCGGRIHKSVANLLAINPTVRDLQKLEKLGVSCIKVS